MVDFDRGGYRAHARQSQWTLLRHVVWTEESERWLKDIFDYIALDNLDAAVSVLARIYERAQSLLQFSESGYKYEGSAEDVRILLFDH